MMECEARAEERERGEPPPEGCLAFCHVRCMRLESEPPADVAWFCRRCAETRRVKERTEHFLALAAEERRSTEASRRKYQKGAAGGAQTVTAAKLASPTASPLKKAVATQPKSPLWLKQLVR